MSVTILPEMLAVNEVAGDFEPVITTVLRNAATWPTRVAVESGGKRLLYGTLMARAEVIAARLVAEGAGPGERVGVCMARSCEMVAVLLGVLLSGAAYVPLDPLFPEERIRAVADDAGMLLMLTDGDGLFAGMRSLNTSRIIAAQTGSAPCGALDEDDAAYVIYTSGSTGKPKGVVIGHGALRSMVCAAKERLGFGADDVLVAITTVTFDLSVMDVFLPLFTGARLVVASKEEARDPRAVRRLIREHGGTLMEATPGFWRAMVEEGWTTRGPGEALLRVLCGGEKMSRDLADLLLERADEVWNGYGPTECTVWASFTRVKAGPEAPGIYDVLPNCEFHVLDDALRRVDAGVVGELVLGGPNVGLGYWKRPELTADRFVPNPFGRGRLYRTGDLAELQPDGRVRLLGRADTQVKVRGYRVELGEIEHVLMEHAAVREAVVVQQAQPGVSDGMSQHLVAYLETGRDLAAEDMLGLVEELCSSMRRALPEYMIPARLVPLPALPRLFNGKLDRKALAGAALDTTGLPATGLAAAKLAEEAHYIGPRDFLERQLAHIWQTALGIPRIGVETGYFSLGADSLSALRMMTIINRTFATEFGLASLLTSPTIASMAKLIREHHAPSVDRALVPLQTSGSRVPLFLLHGVGGNILNFIGLARRLPADQPVYAVQAQSLLTRQPALLRLEDMAAYYVREIRSVQPHGPYRLLGYSFGGTMVAEMTRQLRDMGEEVSLVGMLDSRTQEFDRQRTAAVEVNGAGPGSGMLKRLAGNIETLPMRERARYVGERVLTRTVRGLTYGLHRARVRKMPSMLKVAEDINVMALRMHEPRVNRGQMVLFRASRQDFAGGAKDLGWAGLFSDGVEIHEVQSDHEQMFLEPAVTELTLALTTVLEKTA